MLVFSSYKLYLCYVVIDAKKMAGLFVNDIPNYLWSIKNECNRNLFDKSTSLHFLEVERVIGFSNIWPYSWKEYFQNEYFQKNVSKETGHIPRKRELFCEYCGRRYRFNELVTRKQHYQGRCMDNLKNRMNLAFMYGRYEANWDEAKR